MHCIQDCAKELALHLENSVPLSCPQFHFNVKLSSIWQGCTKKTPSFVVLGRGCNFSYSIDVQCRQK